MLRVPIVCAIGVLLCAALATSRTHAIAQPGLPFPVFEDVAKKAGIDFELESGTVDRQFILESNSAGVVLIDYDNDGWLDVYFVNGSTPDRMDRHEKSLGNRLYHNNHNGTFTDVTEKAGVRGNGAWGLGGCIGDVDNNGFDDIFITNYGPNVLYLNNGDGTFRDASKEAGIEGGDQWHTGCAFGDYDRDGDLDLYVSTYVDFTLEFARKDPRFVNPRAPAGYKLFNPGPTAYKAQPDELYENVGNGHFVDVSEKSGIRNTKPGNGFGVVWGDYNNDGYPDIYVANDLSPNHLFRNNRDKTFTDVGVTAGAALDVNGKPQASMGVDMADYDNDGNLDIIVTNFADDHTTLYRNDGSGGFIDVSKEAGFTMSPFLGWGIQFVDLDLDGFQDLIAVNGHVHPGTDFNTRVTPLQAGYLQRWLGYRNRGNGTFEEIGRTLGEPFTKTYGSRGLAVGDLNNDGQMDLVVTNQEAPQSVLMNKGVPGNWSLLKLRGTRSNRSAIGARVTLRAGGVTQIREVKSGGSYLSQSDLRLHFGLGAATKIDEVSIRWPSGAVQVERDVAANRIVTLTEK